MARRRKQADARYFTADGVEVESIWDLAGPREKELQLQLARLMGRQAALGDHLRMIEGQKKPRKRVLTPASKNGQGS